MNKEIEKGKAIIQLSYLLMILSGFLLATAGITYTNSINTFSSSLPLMTSQSLEIIKINENLTAEKQDLLNNILKVTEEYLNSVKPQLELTKSLFYFGFFLVLFSYIVWNIGYLKIKKVGKNE